MAKPMAVMSYSREDDRAELQRFTRFRQRLEDEVRTCTGDDSFQIFQDIRNLEWGDQWRDRLSKSLKEAWFLIPFVTPRYFKSGPCRDEFLAFREREKMLRREDLILPIYYLTCAQLDDANLRKKDAIAEEMGNRQWEDWRPVRNVEPDTWQETKVIRDLAAKLMGRISALPVSIVTAELADVAESPGTLLIVDAAGNGHYSTITEAINAAHANDRVRVHPGVYNESFTVSKAITVSGAPMADAPTVLLPPGESIVLAADHCTVENLVLKGQQPKAATVDIRSGSPRVLSCGISAASTDCVVVHSAANPVVKSCQLTAGIAGIFFREKARGRVEGCTIERQVTAGIVAMMDAAPTVVGNTITKNGHAIWLYAGAGGSYKGNDLTGNLTNAWSLDESIPARWDRADNKG
jgi:hypothetical protein